MVKLPFTGARAKRRRPTMKKPRPTIERRLDAEPHHEAIGEEQRREPPDQRRGQEREADLERAVIEDELQIERREEEHREHRGRHQDADDVGDGEVSVPKEAERHERRGWRASITMKATNRASDAPSKPRVRPEPSRPRCP